MGRWEALGRRPHGAVSRGWNAEGVLALSAGPASCRPPPPHDRGEVCGHRGSCGFSVRQMKEQIHGRYPSVCCVCLSAVFVHVLPGLACPPMLPPWGTTVSK